MRGQIPDKDDFINLALDGKLFLYANSVNTHYNKHTSDENIIHDMDRLITKTEEKRDNNLPFSQLAESHFEPDDTNVDDINEYVTMMFADAISQNVKDKKDNILDKLENAKHGETVSFTTKINGYDFVGKGVRYNRPNCTMEEVETPAITMVFKRNYASYVGFDFVTAYPDLNHTDAKPTGRNISRELSQVPSYKKLNVVTQMYYKAAVSDSTIKPDYNSH